MLTIPPGVGHQASAPTRPVQPPQDTSAGTQMAVHDGETSAPPPPANRISGADAQALVQGLIGGNSGTGATNVNAVSQRMVADAQAGYGGAALNASLSQVK
ncbi:hypothetical protein [Octadecabacter sp. R77987]|uniref:hypothetical protein n=1 Tax=Octadecabacter sp. R77987 TaxID=3093874 RepID=UPI00367205BE